VVAGKITRYLSNINNIREYYTPYGRYSRVPFYKYFDRETADDGYGVYRFSHSRTSLLVSLDAIQFDENSVILVPEFICNVVLAPLRQLGLKYVFYEINDQLEPIWESINKMLTFNIKAIIMVHYFGQPQNIDQYLEFCSNHNILLIEDNAHGYGSSYNGKLLGHFGDIAISSPWKTFPIYNGSYLYTKIPLESRKYPHQPLKIIKRYFENAFISFWDNLESINVLSRKSVPDIYKKPIYIQEDMLPIWCMDKYSDLFLNSVDLNLVRKKRHDIYCLWNLMCKKKGLEPVFKCLNEESIPSIYPAFASSYNQSLEILKWGYDRGIDVHKWPNLPEKIISSGGNGVKIWKKMICFPININMNLKNLRDIINK
tara:strand:+ start:212 stop:1324 length:1113 start_codon:yes stop_codon:yes gene_type:complete